MAISYDVTALQMTIFFNKEGDHDHNGLMFALSVNVPILKYLEARSKDNPPVDLEALYNKAIGRANELKIDLPDPFAKNSKAIRKAIREARVHSMMRPLVLRCNVGDTVKVELKNEIEDRWVGLHLVGDGYDVKTNDGSHIGGNSHSLVKPKPKNSLAAYTREYTWVCNKEGVFPFHDGGNFSGGEDGTNVHGLFGALIVEPENTIWRDPVTGRTSTQGPLDGLYLDVIPKSLETLAIRDSTTTLKNHDWGEPKEYHNFNEKAHREFVIFFQDEPEYVPPHGVQPEDPCKKGGGHGGGDHGSGDHLPIMPVSYRAEPMINRERILWGIGEMERPVLNEEQHHSSWMFGDPATPILKAYIGDPVRIRFVHAAVKETHVFHLHLYEWHTVPEDRDSPRIDAISVSPQTAHTIEPVWGAGNRHQVAGDVIWHCHLYPHFHEGMWGIFRTFETLQEGKKGKRKRVAFANSEKEIYGDRYIGQYPDGTYIENLLPLPDPERKLPPRPTPTHPGYPLYIPGKKKTKSPIPPWPDRDLMEGETFCDFDSLRASAMPKDFNYRQNPTSLEKNAFNEAPLPGELFTRNPYRPQQAMQWNEDYRFGLNINREVCYDVVMEKQPIVYNSYGWHDKDGHLYYLKREGNPKDRLGPKEPLFFRALHGQILNLTFENRTPFYNHKTQPDIEATEFDHAFPPCPERKWEGECAMHVHMVKFDPICGDGASTGWNYISGPVAKKKMVYRWWLDQEFGTIFFHDHLFANYRQKHGLFGGLIVEPAGAQFLSPTSDKPIISGLQARISHPGPGGVEQKVPLYSGNPNEKWFREFCIGIQDFIPMWDKEGNPLNPPEHPGGHGDQGVMALNYRCEPIHERLKDPMDHEKSIDPALWFSNKHFPKGPATTQFLTFTDEPIWFRLLQGSHEEQHSFQIHGMRWRRFRVNTESPMRNQQTFGLSEAFTFINHETYGPGDYMYKLSGADDLWLGCWGIIRAFKKQDVEPETGLLRLPTTNGSPDVQLIESGEAENINEGVTQEMLESSDPVRTRKFHIVVEAERLVYRDPDLVDPFALVYRLHSFTPPDGEEQVVPKPSAPEPLVIRCREGEWIQVTLENKLPPWYNPVPEPFAPQVPVENVNPFLKRPERKVSTNVSMHADLLLYDVNNSDGATVGNNQVQTAPKGKSVTYTWYVPRSTGKSPQESLGPVLLQDMADFRNHRHHGLVGALIVEDEFATPLRVEVGAPTAHDATEAWHGVRATIITNRPDKPEERIEEAVLLLQDGLRLYLRGDIFSPIPDEPLADGENAVDHEDQGQKGFNYRSEPVGPNADPSYDPAGPNPPGDWLSNPKPATPIFTVPVSTKVRLHLVGACDKPRNHSFTVHGVTWPEWRHLPPEKQSWVASESAISNGSVRTFEFTPQHVGDHAYRSGVLKWAVPQGLWGILRVIKVNEGTASKSEK